MSDKHLWDRYPVVREYSRLASDYDAKWSFYVRATTQETLNRLKLQPTDRVLDVGCGTGILLQQLALTYPQLRLFGLDPVPKMLEVARQRLTATIELSQGWAEKLPFENERFDVVISCNMFHYIRQPMTTLQEIRRVLRSGGQIIVTDWCNDYWTCRIYDIFLRRFDRSHFKTYCQQEFRQILEESGYNDVYIERYKINWFWGLMTVTMVK